MKALATRTRLLLSGALVASFLADGCSFQAPSKAPPPGSPGIAGNVSKAPSRSADQVAGSQQLQALESQWRAAQSRADQADQQVDRQTQLIDQLQADMRTQATLESSAKEQISALRQQDLQSEADRSRLFGTQKAQENLTLRHTRDAIDEEKAQISSIQSDLALNAINIETDRQRAQKEALVQARSRLEKLQADEAQIQARVSEQQAGQVAADIDRALQRESTLRDLEAQQKSAQSEYGALQSRLKDAQNKLGELSGAADVLHRQARDARTRVDLAQP